MSGEVWQRRPEERVWTRKGEGSLLARGLRAPLLILSGIYNAAVIARRRAFQRGLLARSRVGARVIVAGNITVGGVGKTPLAEWTARKLFENGMKSALICRGYKGSAAGPMVVSDGRGNISSPELAGDEPVMLASHLPGVPVVAGKDRTRACETAIKSFGATHLVLDDGFQHLALERDMDIIVLDSKDDPAKHYLLPRGPLREPLTAAASAHAIVLSRADSPDTPRWEWMERVCPEAPVFPMRLKIRGITSIQGDQIRPLNQSSFAFCGIGTPQGFLNTLEEAGVEVRGSEVFKDHHPYTRADIEALAAAAGRCGAQRLITTEKDAVKIRPGWAGRTPLDVLKVEPDFHGAEEELLKLIRRFVGEEEPAA